MARQSKGKSRGFYSDLLIGDLVSDCENDDITFDQTSRQSKRLWNYF